MAKITFKTSASANSSRLVKNLGVIAFNAFASFFNWLIIIICLAILVIGYWWLIKPKYDFIASDQELTLRGREYEEKGAYLRQLNEIKNLYKTISQADKDKVDMILSSRQDLDQLKIILLREVTKVGKEQGFTTDNIIITPLDNSREKFITIAETPGVNPLYDKLKLVQVSFRADGVEYAELRRMLDRLERSLRIMDVTRLTYNPAAQSVSIELVTYYLEK